MRGYSFRKKRAFFEGMPAGVGPNSGNSTILRHHDGEMPTNTVSGRGNNPRRAWPVIRLKKDGCWQCSKACIDLPCNCRAKNRPTNVTPLSWSGS